MGSRKDIMGSIELLVGWLNNMFGIVLSHHQSDKNYIESKYN